MKKQSLESLDNSLFSPLNSQDMAGFKGGAEDQNTEYTECTDMLSYCPDEVWIVDEPGRFDCIIFNDYRFLPPCDIDGHLIMD